MNPNQLAQQITGLVNHAISNPFGFLLWVIGTVAILGVASTVLAPLAPQFIRPMGDVTKWVYVAGFCWLMKGAGR